MSLPTEIRLKIYRHLLCDPDEWVELFYRLFRSTLQIFSVPPMRQRPRVCTAILYTSRQIYTEAVTVLYVENVFCYKNWSYRSGVKMISFPKKRVNLMKYVRIDIEESSTCMTSHKFLSGLTSIVQDMRSLLALNLHFQFHSHARSWNTNRMKDKGLVPRMLASDPKFQDAIMNLDVRQEIEIGVYDEEGSTRRVFQRLVRRIAAAKSWHCLDDRGQYEAESIYYDEDHTFHCRWTLRPAPNAPPSARASCLNG